jgi:hypothetical protein
MATPKYDPEELAKYDLTAEEAEGIRRGLEQIDRGETVDLDASTDEILATLEALTRVRERRAG